jgi:hypothetical protein
MFQMAQTPTKASGHRGMKYTRFGVLAMEITISVMDVMDVMDEFPIVQSPGLAF